MKRKFNYTGRKKINRSDIQITLSERDNVKYFDASINFDRNELPDDARVYIEPYYKYSFMRFDFGTVGEQQKPEKRTLDEIHHTENIKFRVKVVDESTRNGRIIAHASDITPKSDDGNQNREPLFPINFTNLDQEIWRVSFEDTKPLLEINNNIDDHKNLIKSSRTIQALILPAALRIVLQEIISDEEEYDGAGDLWQDKWVRFLKESLFVEGLPDPETDSYQKEEWIQNTVSKFCSRFHFLDNFISEYKGG